MNKYQIQQKIKTLAKIDEDFSDPSVLKAEVGFGGFIFKQWDCTLRDGSTGDAWVVKFDIEAENVERAYTVFSDKMREIVPVMCFISQCYMNFEYESSLVLRKNNNSTRDFILRRLDDREGSPLSFGNIESKSLDKLKNYEQPQVFKFLQESINTSNYHARLAMLFAALEAMSGEITKRSCNCPNGKSYMTYDKDIMKEILGGDLFDELFGLNGLRHKLLHGRLTDFILNDDYFSKIYKAIVKYFNNKFNTKIAEKAVNVPRHFNSKSQLYLFLRPKGEIDLRNVVGIFTEDVYHIGTKIGEYEVMAPIKDY